ncbi:hypothetical protein QFZ78_006778 [Paenibacillus sp. V4I5]|nr:hypothetical protein [Paenibacillus sp. V4I5]MDQ0920518.1 hypothetical protein [Paenibacillus sp. V4I5]
MFIKGADVSNLPFIEKHGGCFRDGGVPKDGLQLMKEYVGRCGCAGGQRAGRLLLGTGLVLTPDFREEAERRKQLGESGTIRF